MSDVTVPQPVDLMAFVRRQRSGEAGALMRGIALFDGLSGPTVACLAPFFKRIELAPGEIVWRQATPCMGLAVVLDGQVQVCLHLPGQRELELTRLGRGDVIGEIPLLGGGAHTATVRGLGRCSLLLLSRTDFAACMMSSEPGVQELRRRLVLIACKRLRRALVGLAATADDARPHRGPTRREAQQGDPLPATPPPLAYLSRLPLFRQLEPGLVRALVEGSTVLAVERGQVVRREWSQPDCCYVTLNGAVEDVVHRRGAPLRVGFAGPGHAFAYIGLLDGEPAPVSSIARESCVLLAIDRGHFEAMISTGGRSRSFATAIERDLIGGLRTAERTLAHLAAARLG